MLMIGGKCLRLRAKPAHISRHLLAGQETIINIFQDLLTLEQNEEKLSRYSVEWQPDERHLARVGNPRFYQHPYQSPQLELWETGSVEWFVIIRTDPTVRQRKHRGHVLFDSTAALANGRNTVGMLC